MKIKAYAKINLGLKVFKGTHESKHKVDSIVFLYKKLYNTVIIKKSKQTRITYIYKSKKKPKHREELIYDTLLYLKKKFGWNINYNIKIIKRIPVGSGLGGSSSDAAAVINYILHSNPPVILDLEDIALHLGSDIPFFLTHYQMARVTKFGNITAPIFNWKPKIHLNLNLFDCATSRIFKALEDDPNYQSKVNIERILTNHLLKQHKDVVYNDLTKYIIQSNNELANLYKKYDSRSFFTGAGSTIVTIKE